MHGLTTDLYQLTMAAGYYEAQKTDEIGTFELFVRRLPHNRNYLIAAGLPQAIDYLRNLSFSTDEVNYLRGLEQFQRVSPGFFDALLRLRFTGDLWAVREGTPLFAGEPFLTLRAPLIEAQLAETYLLSIISFQTMIATKASRTVEAARGRAVVEFGTRRAHSPEAGTLAGRAAYVGGCLGSSNTESGFRFDIPVFGTAAHAWVQSFPHEVDAFRQLQKMLGPATVYLIDTYDTVEGAKKAAALGRPIWGVRLDSGNPHELAPAVRRILDEAGLRDAKIMVTGDLDEYKILELVAAKAPVDAFGVGTSLATSSDAPNLSAVYKLVEIQSGGMKRYTAKYSPEKNTMPGAKQIFRYPDRDVVGCIGECFGCGEEVKVEALLRPVILGGELPAPSPSVHDAREHCKASIKRLPSPLRSLYPSDDPWRVEYSKEMLSLANRVHSGLKEVTA
jgi:nicotinate phosphoribosyltransferase